MEVQIVNQAGQLIWARSPIGGFTSPAYGEDGTLHQIELALEFALIQCRAELQTVNGNRMGDVPSTTP